MLKLHIRINSLTQQQCVLGVPPTTNQPLQQLPLTHNSSISTKVAPLSTMKNQRITIPHALHFAWSPLAAVQSRGGTFWNPLRYIYYAHSSTLVSQHAKLRNYEITPWVYSLLNYRNHKTVPGGTKFTTLPQALNKYTKCRNYPWTEII